MSQINSNTKDDFQVVLLLSCFVEHPVFVHYIYKKIIEQDIDQKCFDLLGIN